MRRRLYRSRSRKIAGVCGGLADYFDIDPTLVRLIAILILVFTGFIPMLIVYLLAWMIIPEELPHDHS